MLDGDTAALFLNHCSNVTGVIQDVRVLSEIVHRHGALLVLDAAQSAGCIPIQADAWGVDALILRGTRPCSALRGQAGIISGKASHFCRIGTAARDETAAR